MVQFAVARRLLEGQAVGRLRRDAETIVVGLDAVVPLTGFRVRGEDEGQEAAGLVAGISRVSSRWPPATISVVIIIPLGPPPVGGIRQMFQSPPRLELT